MEHLLAVGTRDPPESWPVTPLRVPPSMSPALPLSPPLSCLALVRPRGAEAGVEVRGVVVVTKRETGWWSSAVKLALVFRLRITPTLATCRKEGDWGQILCFWKHHRVVKGFPGPNLKPNRQDFNH